MNQENQLGYLRRCMDRRFGQGTREAFEEATGLKPDQYWDESYPGGSALETDDTGVNYAVRHGAKIFGWQAHGDHCGGQPGVEDGEIAQRLDAQIAKFKEQFPDGRHFRIFVTEEQIDIKEV